METRIDGENACPKGFLHVKIMSMWIEIEMEIGIVGESTWPDTLLRVQSMYMWIEMDMELADNLNTCPNFLLRVKTMSMRLQMEKGMDGENACPKPLLQMDPIHVQLMMRKRDQILPTSMSMYIQTEIGIVDESIWPDVPPSCGTNVRVMRMHDQVLPLHVKPIEIQFGMCMQ